MATVAVYSLKDVVVSMTYGADGTQCNISEAGGGRISISYAGDIGSHTTTATGYVVINKLASKAGTCSLEIPVNSDADKYLRGWIKYVKSCANSNFANANLVLDDKMAGRKTTLWNIIPQKEPDEAYDQTSSNRQYNILFTDSTVA